MKWTSVDQYAKIRELEQEVVISSCKYPQYVWLVPIMKPLQVPGFATLQDKYTDAIIGNNRIVDEPRNEKHIKFKLRSRYLGKNSIHHDEWAIQIWFLANKYTMAKNHGMVESFTFSILYHSDSYNLYNRFIEDKLKALFSQV